jgi:hypothetical protein
MKMAWLFLAWKDLIRKDMTSAWPLLRSIQNFQNGFAKMVWAQEAQRPPLSQVKQGHEDMTRLLNEY